MEIIEAFIESENWKPNLTQISKKTKKAKSTLHDYYKRNKNKFEIKIRDLSESEVVAKEKEEKNG